MKHTVTELVLDNGARGLLVHVPEASVMTFDMNFRAGEYLVASNKWEAPHLMEHVLLGANQLLPRARDFHAEFEKNGAYSNASTSVYEITYEAECADFEWQRIQELMLVAITKPLFLETEFKSEYSNVREELTSLSNNHFRHLSLMLRKRYGLAAKTDKDRLKIMSNVACNDVREHYKRTHTASNMRFVLAGNITPSRRQTIEMLFSHIDLPRGKNRRALPMERPHSLQEPVYIRNTSVENLYFYIDTFMQRCMTDGEMDALDILNILLTETFYSKILGKARERGLVYGMHSGYAQLKKASNWWFGTQVMPANAPALFGIIVQELFEIFNGKLAVKDIVAAKAYALGRFQRSAQTVGGTSNGYSNRYFFDDVIDDYYQVPKRIQAVTKKDIVDVARAMFAENVWGFGVLGNCGIDMVRELQTQLAPLWQVVGSTN
ncbi:MAG: M16 family metallopeptidase [Candidatus Saccharimonadales bacterium]